MVLSEAEDGNEGVTVSHNVSGPIEVGCCCGHHGVGKDVTATMVLSFSASLADNVLFELMVVE